MSTQITPQKISPHPAHLRQRVWQIWVPMGAAVLLVLAVMVYAVLLATGSGSSVSEWADVSLIVLILPALVGALVLLALTVGLVVLITLGIQRLPRLTQKVLFFLFNVNRVVVNLSKMAAKPFLMIQGWQSGWRRLRNILFRRSQPSR